MGAIGVLVPVLARITPVLTPGAAGALGVIMLLATAFDRSRREYFALPITLALGALAAFVAWGRLHRAPIVAR